MCINVSQMTLLATRRIMHIQCKLYLMLLAYVTEQTCLPHYKCWSHCSHSVWAYRSDSAAYMYQSTTNYTNYFTLLPYMCHSQICPLNCTYVSDIWWPYIGGIFAYVCYTWSHWHQPRNQEYCTNTTLPTFDVIVINHNEKHIAHSVPIL